MQRRHLPGTVGPATVGPGSGGRPRGLDLLLAVALAAVATAEIWVPFSSVLGSGSRPLASVVAVLTCGALALRRRWPLGTAALVLLPWPLVDLLGAVLGFSLFVLFWGQFVPIAIGLYSVARHSPWRRALVGAALGAGALLYFDLFVDELQQPGEIVFHWLVAVLAWSLGRFVASYERRVHAQAARAVQAEAASRERALEAVAEERARIARELHDIVAHSVSVMVVQAGAASQALDDPAYVASALDSIRSTGTAALDEMRRVVALIRDDDQPAALEPQPGLSRLEALVRAAQPPATLRVEGEARQLSPGLDLAAYRIVQEALTNVRRHAGASTAEVTLRYGEDSLVLEVADDGRGSAEPTGGNGLIGMRERVQMYGGSLVTETAPGAGFRLRAVLPTRAPQDGPVPV